MAWRHWQAASDGEDGLGRRSGARGDMLAAMLAKILLLEWVFSLNVVIALGLAANSLESEAISGKFSIIVTYSLAGRLCWILRFVSISDIW